MATHKKTKTVIAIRPVTVAGESSISPNAIVRKGEFVIDNLLGHGLSD